MDIVRCGSCGEEVPAEAVYCPECARPVAAAVIVELPETIPAPAEEGAVAGEDGPRRCAVPSCGQQLEAGETVCGYCGEPVGGPTPEGPASALFLPWGTHVVREEDSLVLGREHPPFSAQLAQYPNVGRAHARIARSEGAMRVTDLNSTNGTFLDGRRIPPELPEELRPGQILRLGGILEIEVR
ncbi:MAG: FHA domain-containing protein [Solirubrobacterales bacterium]